MNDRSANTIRSTFWMPQTLPEGSNFKVANDRDRHAAHDATGDVAGPQPKPQTRTGWYDDALND